MLNGQKIKTLKNSSIVQSAAVHQLEKNGTGLRDWTTRTVTNSIKKTLKIIQRQKGLLKKER